MKNILYTIILSFIFSSGVFADWTYMTSHDGVDAYLDFDAVERNNGLIYIWGLLDYKTKDPWDNLSSSALHELDCNNTPKRKRVISTRGYSGNMGAGELNISSSTHGDWEYPRPGSLYTFLTKKLCSP
jgi:hypothetical protein